MPRWRSRRFKGLGEMMAAQLKETTMDPTKRTLLRVVLADAERKPTEKSVERLMGNKAEARFDFIQENAEFASEALLDCVAHASADLPHSIDSVGRSRSGQPGR